MNLYYNNTSIQGEENYSNYKFTLTPPPQDMLHIISKGSRTIIWEVQLFDCSDNVALRSTYHHHSCGIVIRVITPS
jgi:hypothetical protein